MKPLKQPMLAFMAPGAEGGIGSMPLGPARATQTQDTLSGTGPRPVGKTPATVDLSPKQDPRPLASDVVTSSGTAKFHPLARLAIVGGLALMLWVAIGSIVSILI